MATRRPCADRDDGDNGRDSFVNDHCRGVNVGFWDGRDVVIANLQALADAAGAENITLTVIATRGERAHAYAFSERDDPQNSQFVSEKLIITEIVQTA
jgi:hypothetical protein